jgi:tRNA-dihydrouridine synthase
VRRIPVIGNGDVTTPEAARRMFEETGCAGVSIGRGAFYNPWIFRQTEAFLATGAEPEDPGFNERLAVMSEHLDRMVSFYGETKGCMMFRRVATWYARRLGPSVFFRRRVFEMRTRAEFATLLVDFRAWRQQFLDERGLLLPRYQPGPQRSSLLDEGDAGDVIAVPKGPIAVW